MGAGSVIVAKSTSPGNAFDGAHDAAAPARVSFARRLKRGVADRVVRFASNAADRARVRVNAAKCRIGERAVLYASAKIDNDTGDRDRIHIGTDTQVLSNLQVFPHGGRITIGDHCYLEQTRIWSMQSIVIGHRVLVSHGVNIHDHNAHSLSADDRHRHLAAIVASGHPATLENVRTRAVEIGDDAWIGFNATILKGVTIGRGAIVGACSVVTRDVEPFTIVAGNPATVVGTATP